MEISIDWRNCHDMAMISPNGEERPIVLLNQAISAYINNAEQWNYSLFGEWRDYELGPQVGALLQAFVGLLVGPTGRLDSGLLDDWARSMANRIGYNMDTGTYGGS